MRLLCRRLFQAHQGLALHPGAPGASRGAGQRFWRLRRWAAASGTGGCVAGLGLRAGPVAGGAPGRPAPRIRWKSDSLRLDTLRRRHITASAAWGLA
eukprot:101127-Pyramimonas_sp.AAC.1